jgi:transcriptional regulator with XRE-family HTH domain
MDNIVLGKRIREARLQKKMTQEQLSEKANIGLYFLGEVERGIKTPSLKVFVAIAEALGVSTDSLLRDSVSAGSIYVNNEITRSLDTLTPKQRACAVEVLEAYIKAIK